MTRPHTVVEISGARRGKRGKPTSPGGSLRGLTTSAKPFGTPSVSLFLILDKTPTYTGLVYSRPISYDIRYYTASTWDLIERTCISNFLVTF